MQRKFRIVLYTGIWLGNQVSEKKKKKQNKQTKQFFIKEWDLSSLAMKVFKVVRDEVFELREIEPARH